jgi:hypothetical protein
LRHAQVSANKPGDASTSGALAERLEEGVRIRELLRRNTEEMEGVLRALNGEYILPEAGGDLLRDGAGVLPTGTLSRAHRIPLAISPVLRRERSGASPYQDTASFCFSMGKDSSHWHTSSVTLIALHCV